MIGYALMDKVAELKLVGEVRTLRVEPSGGEPMIAMLYEEGNPYERYTSLRAWTPLEETSI